MKKNNFGKALCAIALGLLCLNSTGQTESDNLKKYWNYREKYKKNFIKIGPNKGEGINIANIDTMSSNIAGETGYNWINMHPQHGYKRWGDAMAMQGDYISVLSTEYKLLKDAGKSTLALQNELYYAINAIDRLDGQAEIYYGGVSSPPIFNGFFIRDDADSTTTNDWENEYQNSLDYRDKCDGVKSDFYVDHLANNFNMQNEMSQDQMFGLWQGFLHVIKLVDNIYVKPTPSDAGFYLHNKVKDLTNRMFSYITNTYHFENETRHLFKFDAIYLNVLSQVFAGVVYPIPHDIVYVNSTCNYDENWVLVNPITHEKVENGSEIRPYAFPTAKTAEIITGIPHSQGNGIHINGNDIFNDGNVCLLNSSYTFSLSDINSLMWNPLQNIQWDVAYVNGVKKWCFNLDPSGIAQSLGNNALNFCIEEDSIKGKLKTYNVFMALQLATMSQTWTKENVVRIADNWHMEVFDLMYAVLNNTQPVHSKQYWDSILVTAPCNGPYNYNPVGNSDPSLISGDWNENSRWAGNNGPSDFTRGEYNGNDYMLAYNLYRIAFADQLNQDEYTDISCSCENSPKLQANTNVSAQTLTNNTVVKRKFANDYLPIGIKLKEFSINNLQIPSTKQLDVQTDLVVCNNSTMKIKNGGKIVVGDAASPQSSIIVRSGSTLHIEGNGRLNINDNCKVVIEKGASLVYDAGAIIQLLGNDAVLEIQGDLVLGNTAVFKFTYPNTTSGYVKFSDPDFAQAPYDQIRTVSAGQTASIELRGANKNDKILEVAQDLLQVAIGNGITTFKVEYGLVDFTYNNGACYISSDANVRFYNSKFTKAPSIPPSMNHPSNVAVWGQAQCQITACEFSPGVGLIGNLFAYGNKLTITGTLAYGGIRTQGAGLTLNSVTTSSLISELMSFNSIATNSKFIDGEGASIIASPVEFDFNSCRANNNYFSGYRVDGPTLLKVKCGQVKTNQYTGFHLANNASLSMNVTDNGGYVDARDNAVNTILLDNAHSIDIENGYNDLRPYDFYSVTSSQTSSSACVNFANCGYVVIEGSIQQLPVNPIFSDNNRWQLSTNSTLFPLQATNGKDKYTRVSSTYSLPGSNDVRFVASSQSPIVACDYWNTSCTTCPKSYLEICPTCHVINTDDFTNVKTNEAVKSAITKLATASTDTAANKQSVDMLYQVLQYPLPVANDGDKYVKSIAEKKILVALASGIEKSEIKVSEQQLSPEVMKVLEVVDSKILKAQADNNYDHLQNAVYEKALLYYSSKHRTDALSTLNQYLPSIQTKDHDRFNRLVCQITNEQQLLNGEISQYDYLRSIENCVPIQRREGSRRTLTIPSEESAEIETLAVQVYPNPAEDQLNIQFSQVLLLDASFNIYDLTGKLVFSTQLKAGVEKSEVTGFDLSNGMYIYKVSSGEEILQQGKLSIIK